MSDLPSKSDWIRNAEVGVYESCTATPFASKKPCRCAAQIGRFQPPSKAMTRSEVGAGVDVGDCACALDARTAIAKTINPFNSRMAVLQSSGRFFVNRTGKTPAS